MMMQMYKLIMTLFSFGQLVLVTNGTTTISLDQNIWTRKVNKQHSQCKQQASPSCWCGGSPKLTNVAIVQTDFPCWIDAKDVSVPSETSEVPLKWQWHDKIKTVPSEL